MTEELTGKAKGGKAAADKMTAEERKARSLKANAAKQLRAVERTEISALPKATHGDASHPLTIGAWEVPCYVLEDKRRVLVQRGVMEALDMSQGTAGRGGGDRNHHAAGAAADGHGATCAERAGVIDHHLAADGRGGGGHR